ncbi:Sentrin-specific protease 1 [Lamellibrachia satsuma]|nr:Sentrin-specific protease 1 [Lamellibrachia satsuma]
MISKFLAFFTGHSKEPSRKRSQISSAYDEESERCAKRQKSEVKPYKWMPRPSFTNMADWVEQRKLSFADSFYYQPKDHADRQVKMTTVSSLPPQCDPLVARDGSFLSGTPAAPKSSYSSLAAPKSSYASGYQFQSLVNPTVMSGNRFKFGNATDVEFKAPPSRQKAGSTVGGSGYRQDPYCHGSKRGPSVASRLLGVRGGSRFLQRQHVKLAAKESIQLEERNRYAQLLQHYSTVLSDQTSLAGVGGNSHNADSSYFNLSLANATSQNCTLLGTSIAPHGLSKQKPETTRPSRTPSKPLERVGPSLHHKPTPVKSRTETPRKSVIVKEQVICSPLKRRNISKSPAKTSDKPEVIDLDSDSEEGKGSDVEIIEVKKTLIPLPKSPAASFFEKSFQGTKFVNEQWIEDFHSRYTTTERIRCKQIQEEEAKLGYYSGKRGEWEDQLTERIERKLSISERVPVVLEEEEYIEESSEEESEEEIDEFPELTEEQEGLVDRALGPYSPNEVLSDGFRLQITRGDMTTLKGLNWLNDEIINFYMNLLMDRGNKSSDEGGTGFKVHAFNTFFYPKIMSAGHAGVRRWTRKIDALAVDFILIPVHLGMHWCLAVVDFSKKEIRYFDSMGGNNNACLNTLKYYNSMGGNNNACLNTLKEYLMAESIDKKKEPYDMTGWKLFNVKDIPQQMNGSDCGMFSCKYAEYTTRNAPINFTQEHMPYFRRRMVYEILTKKLM